MKRGRLYWSHSKRHKPADRGLELLVSGGLSSSYIPSTHPPSVVDAKVGQGSISRDWPQAPAGQRGGCTRQWDPGDSAGADGQTHGQTHTLTISLPFLLLKQPVEDFSV